MSHLSLKNFVIYICAFVQPGLAKKRTYKNGYEDDDDDGGGDDENEDDGDDGDDDRYDNDAEI